MLYSWEEGFSKAFLQLQKEIQTQTDATITRIICSMKNTTALKLQLNQKLYGCKNNQFFWEVPITKQSHLQGGNNYNLVIGREAKNRCKKNLTEKSLTSH